MPYGSCYHRGDLVFESRTGMQPHTLGYMSRLWPCRGFLAKNVAYEALGTYSGCLQRKAGVVTLRLLNRAVFPKQ